MYQATPEIRRRVATYNEKRGGFVDTLQMEWNRIKKYPGRIAADRNVRRRCEVHKTLFHDEPTEGFSIGPLAVSVDVGQFEIRLGVESANNWMFTVKLCDAYVYQLSARPC